MGGVDCPGKQMYVGTNCCFDTLYPNNIHLGKHVHITAGVVILTHYLNTNGGKMWRSGHVYIDEYAFIGTHSIICKDVRIGKNAIVAAGSVVTKDIPANEIWGGTPARFIKKRNPWDFQDSKEFE